MNRQGAKDPPGAPRGNGYVILASLNRGFARGVKTSLPLFLAPLANPRRLGGEAASYRCEPGLGSPSAKSSVITQQPFLATPKAIPTRV